MDDKCQTERYTSNEGEGVTSNFSLYVVENCSYLRSCVRFLQSVEDDSIRNLVDTFAVVKITLALVRPRQSYTGKDRKYTRADRLSQLSLYISLSLLGVFFQKIRYPR